MRFCQLRIFLLYRLRNLAHIFRRTWSSYHVPESLERRSVEYPNISASGTYAFNDLTTAEVIHTLDTATTGVDVTDNIAHVFFRHSNLNLHDRLKKYRSPPSALLP